jgi:acetyl esterase
MTSKDNPALHSAVAHIRNTVFPTFPKLQDGLAIPVGSITDLNITAAGRSTPVRVYRPATPGPHAAVFYLHGGAFCLSSNADDEPMARQLVNEAGCAVFSIDYGLAPELPFPGALEEAYEVIRQVVADDAGYQVDPGRVAVAGNSAGATLATALCILATRRRHFSFKALSAIYPLLDASIPHSDKLTGKAAASALRPELIEMLVLGAYLNGDRTLTSDPLVSPLLTDDFSIFPPTVLVTAERCPLTPENLRFANCLRANGVEVLHKHCVGVDHGFMDMGGAEVLQRECKTLVAAQLKIWLNR